MENQNQSIELSIYKLCLKCFKYIPIICTLAFAIDCALLLSGTHIKFVALGFGTSFTSSLSLFAASYAFRFCWVHRACITYNFVMSLCINYEVVFGFGSLLTGARVLMLLVGIFLIIKVCLIRYRKWKKTGILFSLPKEMAGT